MAVPTPTFGTVSTGAGTSVQPTLPSYSSGDLLICFTVTDGSETHSIDQGYSAVTGLGDLDDGQFTMSVMAKVAGASETAPTVSFTSEGYASSVISISGQYSSWEGAISTPASSSSATITAPGVTTTVDDSLCLAFGGNDRDRGTPGTPGNSWSDGVRSVSSGSGGCGYAIASKDIASSSTATSDCTWTISASDQVQGVVIEILSAAAPATQYGTATISGVGAITDVPSTFWSVEYGTATISGVGAITDIPGTVISPPPPYVLTYRRRIPRRRRLHH